MPKNKRNLAPLPMRPIGIALFIILSLLLSALPVFAESTRGQLPERPDIVTALETTAPTLLSSEVLTSGDVISLDFDKDLHTDSAKLPPVTAFILLANQTEVRIGSVGLSRTDPRRLLLIPRHNIYAGEVVTLSYTDPTPGDDTFAIQDTDGNDAGSFTEVSVTNLSTRIRPIVSLSASPRGPNSIWLEWGVFGDFESDDLVGYDLQYSSDGGNNYFDLIDYTGDRTDLQYTMHRGLQPAARYEYRISPIFNSSPQAAIVETSAVTEPQPPVVGGLSYTGAPRGHNRASADLCWVPENVDISELTNLQYGYIYFRYNENSAMPWEDDGTYAFNDVNGRSCSGDEGIGIRKTYLAGQDNFVRLRAMKDGELIESNEVVINVANPNVRLKSRILAEGFYGRGPDGELVFPDVPKTVTSPFEVAIGFGYHFPADAATTQVTGLAIADFEVTNATLSEPEGGSQYEDFIGYRLLVTPTEFDRDINLKVKAGTVTGVGTSQTNLASDTFRCKTTSSP